MTNTTWTKTDIRILCPVCRETVRLEMNQPGPFEVSALRIAEHADGMIHSQVCEASHRPMMAVQSAAANAAAALMGRLGDLLGK